MAFDLAKILADVPDLGTNKAGREQIEYLPLDCIDPDPNNFYELSEIDELAANIELLGLQQPLRVRASDQPGRVIVVSGHRRRAALQLLAEEGNGKYTEVPCICETDPGSVALQELRLIYANSDTRKLTPAELGKQAERVEALLYQLKEEGMDFPGRMRDHVAEACKLSKSKLSRLKVIRDKLAPDLMGYWDKGELSETVAYALAKLPVESQRAVVTYRCKEGGAKGLSEWRVESTAELYSAKTQHPCELCSSGRCEHAGVMLDKIYDRPTAYVRCEYSSCCSECSELVSCRSACPMLADKAAQLRTEKKMEAQERKTQAAAAEEAAVDKLRPYWRRFGKARRAAGVTVEELFAPRPVLPKQAERWEDNEDGDRLTSANALPLGLGSRWVDIKDIVPIADKLGVSIDYLMLRTDVPDLGTSATEADAAPGCWLPGAPSSSGRYALVLDLLDGQGPDTDLYWYDAETGVVSWYEHGCPVLDADVQILHHYPVPADPEV